MIEVGLLGYGYWGPNLARNVHESTGGRLAACCDADPQRLETAGRLYPGITLYRDPEEVFADPTLAAVVIATPARTHTDLIRRALLAGKHVLVEKPMTLDSSDGEELTALAAGKDLVLMVGHTFEYNPAVLSLKETLDAGDIGDVYYAYSVRVNLGRIQQDLNALWSIAPHDVSIMLFLLQEMPVEVSTRGVCRLTPGLEDVVFLDMVFPSGVIVHVHASWLDPSKVRQLTIVGSKRMVVYDDAAAEGKLRIYDKGALKVGTGPLYGEFQYRVHSGDIHIPRIDMTEPLRNECEHFFECIRTGARPRSDGDSGVRVVRVLEAAQRSLDQGGVPVRL